MPPGSDAIRWRDRPEPADVERVRALVGAAGVFTDEEVRVAGELVETTLSGAETYRFLFAEQDETLAGYACFDRIPLSAVSFDLYWIVVAPGQRRSGLGRALVTRTTNLARVEGGIQLFAETSSRDQYAAARAFYLKAGFHEAARFADFYALGDDKIVYRLRFGSS